MTEFSSNDNKHDYVGFLFKDAGNEVERFKKERPEFKVEVISDKRQDRIRGMAIDANNIGKQMVLYCSNAVHNICVADTLEERIAQAMGMEGKKIGIVICKDCLSRAITLTKQNLDILHDIQDAISA